MHKNPSYSIFCLPRVECISPQEFETNFIQPQMPCIISGLAKWPALELWDRSYLRDIHGDRIVRASRSVNHMHPDLSHAPAPPPTIRLRFADYVDLVWSGATSAKNLFAIGDSIPIYSEQTASPKEVSPLLNDVELPQFVDRTSLRFVGLWLSARGTASWLHYDANGCHNLNVQVRGRKRVVLCSPDRCDLLYPYARTTFDVSFGQFSQVNVFEPDLDRFPLFAHVVQWTGTLEVGDALFIPAYWYHAFSHNGDVNINVNFWWLPERQFVNGVTAREVLLAALAKDTLDGDAGGDVAAKVAALGGDMSVLIRRLELAVFSPRLPGRSERV
jgi:Cupin-like domain